MSVAKLHYKRTVAGFYFRELLAGRDFVVNAGNIIERQIFSSAKQHYVIGDARTREAVVVDVAWDVKGLRSFAAVENMRLVGAVVMHYHFDHTGGTPPPPFNQLGIKVPRVRELTVEDNLPVYVNLNDATTVMKSNGVPSESLTLLEDAAEVSVGSVKLKFIQSTSFNNRGISESDKCEHPDSTHLLQITEPTTSEKNSSDSYRTHFYVLRVLLHRAK